MPATRSHRRTGSGHRRSESYRSGGLTRPTTSNRSPIATSSSALPRAPARPARGVRPASPRGPASRGGGRDARNPGRHCALATALRHPRAARRLRRGPGAGDSARRTPGVSDQLFERAVRDWLEDGSDRTPRPAIDAVLLAVKTTRQERDLRIPRRFKQMPTYMRLAAGIAIVAVVGVGVLAYFTGGPNTGAPPTPAPTTQATPTPSPLSAGPPHPVAMCTKERACASS